MQDVVPQGTASAALRLVLCPLDEAAFLPYFVKTVLELLELLYSPVVERFCTLSGDTVVESCSKPCLELIPVDVGDLSCLDSCVQFPELIDVKCSGSCYRVLCPIPPESGVECLTDVLHHRGDGAEVDGPGPFPEDGPCELHLVVPQFPVFTLFLLPLFEPCVLRLEVAFFGFCMALFCRHLELQTMNDGAQVLQFLFKAVDCLGILLIHFADAVFE